MISKYKNTTNFNNIQSPVRGELYTTTQLGVLQPITAYTNFGSDDRDVIEFHIYDVDNNILASNQVIPTNYWAQESIKINNNQGAPGINIDIYNLIKNSTVTNGRFKISYNFFRDVIGNSTFKHLFVSDISPSRTEIRLKTVGGIKTATELLSSFLFITPVYNKISNYLYDLVINFGKNRTASIVNWYIDIDPTTTTITGIVLKLSEPLDLDVIEKEQCWITQSIIDSIIDSVSIISTIPITELSGRILRGPNWDISVHQSDKTDSGFNAWDDLLNANETTTQQLVSNIFDSATANNARLNVDYREFGNFIHFSSAEERIKNFRYKVELVEFYDTQLGQLTGSITGSFAVSNNRISLDNKKTQVINSFDSFEQYMYFESGSYDSSSLGEFIDVTWPKTNTTKPYILAPSTSSLVEDWFNERVVTANLYDRNNYDALLKTVPEHIQIDPFNDQYVAFIHMVGQFFDTVWLYIDHHRKIGGREEGIFEGMSRDLIHEVAASLGWDMEESHQLNNLWSFLLGTDNVGTAIGDGDIQPDGSTLLSIVPRVPREDVSKEIWKRIVNNIPFFLQTKGSNRSIRALLACYGIPTTLLRIKEYGGPEVPGDTKAKHIVDTFSYGLRFDGTQNVRANWEVGPSGLVPSTIEFRLNAPKNTTIIGAYNKTVVQVGNRWGITLNQSGSSIMGDIRFVLDGVNSLTSSVFPIFDGDSHWSVMLRRDVLDDTVGASQTYRLSVKKHTQGRINYSYTGSFATTSNANYVTPDDLWIGGNGSYFGGQYVGTMQEFRMWDDKLLESTFDEHVLNPAAYNGDTLSGSFDNIVAKYPFRVPKSHNNSSAVSKSIADESPNQSYLLPATASGYIGDTPPYESFEEQYFISLPSTGFRPTNNKVRLESSVLTGTLQYNKRVEQSQFDTSPLDSNKVGIYFSPTDNINEDIYNQIGSQRLDDAIGDPLDEFLPEYSGLKDINIKYWKKYRNKGTIFEFIRLIGFYDKTLFKQVKKLLPARVNAHVGLLFEPHALERAKIKRGRPNVVNLTYEDNIVKPFEINSSYITYTGSIDYTKVIGGSDLQIPTTLIVKDFNVPSSYLKTLVTVSNNGSFVNIGSPTIDADALMPIIIAARPGKQRLKLKSYYTGSMPLTGLYSTPSFRWPSVDGKFVYSQSLEDSDIQDQIARGRLNHRYFGSKLTGPAFNVAYDEGDSSEFTLRFSSAFTSIPTGSINVVPTINDEWELRINPSSESWIYRAVSSASFIASSSFTGAVIVARETAISATSVSDPPATVLYNTVLYMPGQGTTLFVLDTTAYSSAPGGVVYSPAEANERNVKRLASAINLTPPPLATTDITRTYVATFGIELQAGTTPPPPVTPIPPIPPPIPPPIS